MVRVRLLVDAAGIGRTQLHLVAPLGERVAGDGGGALHAHAPQQPRGIEHRAECGGRDARRGTEGVAQRGGLGLPSRRGQLRGGDEPREELLQRGAEREQHLLPRAVGRQPRTEDRRVVPVGVCQQRPQQRLQPIARPLGGRRWPLGRRGGGASDGCGGGGGGCHAREQQERLEEAWHVERRRLGRHGGSGGREPRPHGVDVLGQDASTDALHQPAVVQHRLEVGAREQQWAATPGARRVGEKDGGERREVLPKHSLRAVVELRQCQLRAAGDEHLRVVVHTRELPTKPPKCQTAPYVWAWGETKPGHPTRQSATSPDPTPTKAFCRTGLGGSSGAAVARGLLGAGSSSAESERNAGGSLSASAERSVDTGWLAPSEPLPELICSSASPSPVPASSMLTALGQTSVPPDVLLLLIVAASSMAASLGVWLGAGVLSEDTDIERSAGAPAADSVEATAACWAELPGALLATASAMAVGVNDASAAAEAASSQGGGSLVPAGPSTARAHASASWRVSAMERRLVESILSMADVVSVRSLIPVVEDDGGARRLAVQLLRLLHLCEAACAKLFLPSVIVNLSGVIGVGISPSERLKPSGSHEQGDAKRPQVCRKAMAPTLHVPLDQHFWSNKCRRASRGVTTRARGERTCHAKVDHAHAPGEGAARVHEHGVVELDVVVGVASGVHEENGNRGLHEALSQGPLTVSVVSFTHWVDAVKPLTPAITCRVPIHNEVVPPSRRRWHSLLGLLAEEVGKHGRRIWEGKVV
eukprot:scaffold114890_cov63-Phaeocystis_antarctica.AAC.4